jgi:hypothetical protein
MPRLVQLTFVAMVWRRIIFHPDERSYVAFVVVCVFLLINENSVMFSSYLKRTSGENSTSFLFTYQV